MTARVNGSSPWGTIDFARPIGNGIVSVSTPSHGGYFVPADQLAKIPPAHRAYAAKWSGSEQWYEEDCAWACVAMAFPEFFPPDALEAARETVANWVDKKPQRELQGGAA